MFHADMAASGADRLIEWIVVARRAEQVAIARAEARDRVGVKLHLADRLEVEARHVAGRALAHRIEAADALQHVAEKVEAQRFAVAGGIDVDDAAAQGIFAGLHDGVAAAVAVGLQEGGQLVEIDGIAGLGGEARALEERR